MTKLPQALDDGRTAILVGVQSGHRLDVRRLLDGLVNHVAMGGIIGPGGVQICLREVGVMLEDAPIRASLFLPFYKPQTPYRGSCAAGISATKTGKNRIQLLV